ncbi:zinc finger protein 728-like [Myzus persicae]|uniref:zinc finger protein 728-like n=1 Tax=Myzus persicae TaxID=13164 RepID=UPI000B9386B6|nr:zinc finger protein 728-like [Myzus persicae]
MASVNQKAKILCTVDDICLRENVDPIIGFGTHRSGVMPVAICSTSDKKLLKFHRQKYIESLGPCSPFEYQKCYRYPKDEDFGVKVVAKKTIYMNNLITELYGSMAPVTDDFFSDGIREYSVVKSIHTGETKLWLGPAAFLNHDCEANTDIYALGSTSAIVKANKKIKRGEEITVFYGEHYFGENNKDCLCHSCEYKKIGHFQVNQGNEQGAGCPMTNAVFSEEDCTEPRDDVFTCDICGHIFLFKCWLERHIASHMQPIHACEYCDRVFNRKDTLKRHIQTVHNKVKHSCNICDAKFSTTHARTRHISRIHSIEDNIVHCPICPSTFNCQQNLQYHNNLKHTQFKPYKCKECYKGFETPYLLHIHRRSHDRQRND